MLKTKSAAAKPGTLQELLQRPLPPEIEGLRNELLAAYDAFRAAQSATDAVVAEDTGTRLAEAERKLTKLEISRDVAGPLGSDAPTEAEIDAAAKDVAQARLAHGAKDQRVALYREAIEEKREALDAAHTRLSAALDDWKQPIRESVEANLANAATLANEALLTLHAIDSWRNFPAPIAFPKVLSEGNHSGPRAVTLPEHVAPVFADWGRINRRLLRP